MAHLVAYMLEHLHNVGSRKEPSPAGENRLKASISGDIFAGDRTFRQHGRHPEIKSAA